MKTFWILSAILLLHADCLQGISPPFNPPSSSPISPPVSFGQLKTTFNRDPAKGFNDEPVLRCEAEAAGFEQIGSGCQGNENILPYPGYFLVQRLNNETGRGGEIMLIFDGQGKIAGIGSVIEVYSSVDPDPNDFQHSTFQLLKGLNGTSIFASIAYFVPPSSVCHGRSYKEFKEQGTGTGMYIVNGPTVEDIIKIPLHIPENLPCNNEGYFRGECVNRMGIHYFFHNPSDPDSVASDCSDAPGIQLLYDAKKPHQAIGLVFQTPVSRPGKRWEDVPAWALRFTFGLKYPKCFDDKVNGGAKSMHVYIGDHRQTCPKPT